MTDHHDSTHPNDPIGAGDTTDAADARWFREAVAPVVDARPVPDAWDTILARAIGEGPSVMPRSPAPCAGHGDHGFRSARHRLLLAVAAIVAIAGIGATSVIARNDRDRQAITATPTPPNATGWYVPVGLPAGWKLESVATERHDVGGRQSDCPCNETFWQAAYGRASVAVNSFRTDADLAGTDLGVGLEEIELPRGLTGHVGKVGPYEVVTWVDAEHAWQVASRWLARSAVVRAASHLVTNPEDPPLDRYRELRRTRSSYEGVRAYHSVTVKLRNERRGLTVAYRLEPFPSDQMITYLAGTVEQVILRGAVEKVDRVRIDRTDDGAPNDHVLYFGAWPGVWVSAGIDGASRSDGPATEADLEAVLASLRPATTTEWHAFLDTAAGDVADNARATTLADLIVANGTGTSDHAASTSSPSEVAATGTIVTSPLPFDTKGLPAGWEAMTTSEPASGRVAAGQPLTIAIEVTNTGPEPRPLTACTWSLISVDRPNDQGQVNRGPCDVATNGSVKQEYVFPTDSLAPGRYRAETRFPGFSFSDPVLVLPQFCTGDADVTDDYAGLSEALARTEAAMRNGTDSGFRVMWRDGNSPALTMDLRTDRVNVMIEDGKVIGACTF